MIVNYQFQKWCIAYHITKKRFIIQKIPINSLNMKKCGEKESGKALYNKGLKGRLRILIIRANFASTYTFTLVK
jgi:hypothetical protein